MVQHYKKRKVETDGAAKLPDDFGESAVIRFYDAKDSAVGDEVILPLSITVDELSEILYQNLTDRDSEDAYSLVLSDHGLEINKSLAHSIAEGLERGMSLSTEDVLKISFYKMASFRVRPVSRLAGSLSGHQGNVVCAAFSADGTMLVTGSGDCEARVWDLNTVTPQTTLQGHTRCVECVAWSPDNRFLATGSEDKTVKVWSVDKQGTHFTLKHTFCHHRGVITSLAWLPLHLHQFQQSGAPLLASASKDGSIRVFDVVSGRVIATLDGHTAMVTSVKWSAMEGAVIDDKAYEGPFIYSSSRDTTLRVWSVKSNCLLREIKSHGHWVNSLSCNTDAICRYGAYNPDGGKKGVLSVEEQVEIATKIWNTWRDSLGVERVVTCSDDNTLSLWVPMKSSKRLAQMVGHQKGVLHGVFSPNGKYIASAACDSSVRLWDGRTGKFIHTYRGHVGPVHQLAWAPDSRLIVSGSRDSTLKTWIATANTKGLKEDLPGHADEVYAVDWSVDGGRVASGGRDKMVRIWAS